MEAEEQRRLEEVMKMMIKRFKEMNNKKKWMLAFNTYKCIKY